MTKTRTTKARTTKTRTTTFAIIALTSLVPLAAQAQGQPGEAGFAPTAEAGGGFGAQGQIVLSLGGTADEHLFFHKDGGAWQLQVAPAADYLLAPRFSIGGAVGFDHANGGGGTNGNGTTTFRVAPRVGYVYDFTDRLGVWPLGGLAFDVTSANHDTSTNTYVVFYVPFLYHLATHFFVGLGPSAQLHLTGNDESAWGIDSMLGGWF